MTAIPIAAFIILDGGARLADGLAEERCIRTEEARDALPAGTVTVGADDCYAVADGHGEFFSIGLTGTFPANESVVLPAYVIAWPWAATADPWRGKSADQPGRGRCELLRVRSRRFQGLTVQVGVGRGHVR